ncbi:autotransporter [Pantoea sp. RIT-PI-b]|uniref:autotransporter family protein n=1 Tax=Pantoea sp. RIT-PI-b TaxID=1681195 RepID=UPI000675C462|nr:autotransporter domain-containing protein [Pantoea sp. RIT-PI-b]KNC05647.1 autotransporter [Pantoea sp. RIT-PI-b]
MVLRFSKLQKAVGFSFAVFVIFSTSMSSAYALSNGCTSVNALSGSSSLSFTANAFPAADFEAVDALVVSFTDSGAGYGQISMDTDSIGLTTTSYAGFQTYYTSQSTSTSPHTETLSIAAGNLAASGLRLRLDTSHGQISNVVFTCTGAAATPSSDATLSNLSVSSGILTPSFVAGTTHYSVAVANSVSSISLTPVSADANATITVNGNAVTSGSASGTISLAAGSTTTITTAVTAEDGTTKSYIVDATRAVASVVANNSSATVAANSSGNVIPLPTSGGAADSFAIVAVPGHGSVNLSGSTLIYTPTAGYSGTDAFSWNATNASGTSSNAVVTMTVTAPTLILSPASGSLPGATVGDNVTVALSVGGGTAPYTWTATGLPAGLTINSSNGEISGSPSLAGSYSPQVTATDVYGASIIAHYTLSIAAAGSAPVVSPLSANISADSSDNAITLPIAGSVTSVAVIRQATHGIARVIGTRIRYTPVSGYSGADSFTYTATNAYGTSAEATVNLTVSAVSMALEPAGGVLPNGTVGSSYARSFSASGGTAPYRWQLSGVLPQGITFAAGELRGIPQVAGSFSFALTATDSHGASTQSVYTLPVTPAAAVAADHTASLYAGQSVKVTLSEGATGGPFTSAQLLDAPQTGLGSATISSSGGNYQLLFTAAQQASGTVALRYTLTSASGTTQPARVTFTIASRPNPATDADVIGLISAQVQAAQNFARAQIRNFNDRLEQLHSGVMQPAISNAIRFNMPTSRPERGADNGFWSSAWQAQRQYLDTPAQQHLAEPAAPFAGRHETSRLSWWTGGYIDFGHDKDDAVRFSHTTVGITTGADYRFTPAFTAGMGIGLGRDVSDVGDAGSRTNGRAISSALYGSWHPNAFFVDGLLGYNSLTFDSRRHVSEFDAVARGSRDGHQVFTSLTTGYEFRTPLSLLSPYARVQYYRTWLDGYSESNAGIFNLAYASQEIAQGVTTGGLRAEHNVLASWGVIKLHSRLEYSQLTNNSGSARVGYADVADDSWNIPLYQQSRRSLALGAGFDFLLPHNITPGIAYQGTLGLDQQKTRSQAIMVRINIGF